MGLAKHFARRADTMDSTLIDSEGLLWGWGTQIQEEVLPRLDNPVLQVQTHPQTKLMEAESAPTQGEHPRQSKQQRKFGQTSLLQRG